MLPPGRSPGKVLFLAPEEPTLGGGGGGLRSASLLEYLQTRYNVEVVTFSLREHSKTVAARAWRNGMRLLRGSPPLFDRFSGYQDQIAARLKHQRYAIAVVEHFWCASYADLLRPHCGHLVLDLHNVESQLAYTHALAARWPESWASRRFGEAYERLERHWLPKFDTLLVASEDDRRRITHPSICVYPNALPVLERPTDVVRENERQALIFTGNLEYHPNIEAIRWFRSEIWPALRNQVPALEWRLAGINPHAIQALVAGDSRIRVIGPVQDAVATLAGADIAVVPLLSGSGTRFKILEAWAAARPVVSTSIGAEGLGAIHGEHLLIADDAASFAAAILQLIQNAPLRATLGEAGRDLYLRNFTWPAAWRQLEQAAVL